MYYVYFNTASGNYNLRTDKGTRSLWCSKLHNCIASVGAMLKVSKLPDSAILLYEDTTIPTPDSNPELFI